MSIQFSALDKVFAVSLPAAGMLEDSASVAAQAGDPFI
jgi:hypothetical protein